MYDDGNYPDDCEEPFDNRPDLNGPDPESNGYY